jgi:hypothetical protein
MNGVVDTTISGSVTVGSDTTKFIYDKKLLNNTIMLSLITTF